MDKLWITIVVKGILFTRPVDKLWTIFNNFFYSPLEFIKKTLLRAFKPIYCENQGVFQVSLEIIVIL